jgi:hypothetical protein
MAKNAYEADSKLKLYPNSVDDIVDEASAHFVVREVFKEISRRFGEEKAAKMFRPYGRFNNIDRTAHKNADLIWRLYHMKKPGIAELARSLSGRGKNRENQVDALKKQIQRALDKKRPEGRRARAVVKSWEEEAGYPVLPDSVDRMDLLWKWLKSGSLN